MTTPICPYCSQPAKLVTGEVIYSHRPDLADKKFWQCAPCKAYVGCHKAGSGPAGYARGDGTVPLGRLANAELRMWKGKTHVAFDAHWNGFKYVERRRVARIEAYARLAADLGIPASDCHIGMFDVEMCKRAVRICTEWIHGVQA